jgi:hypothetical protein
MNKLETKTSTELQRMFADESGLNPGVISVYEIGDDGDFGASVIGGIALIRNGTEQSKIEAIRDRLRLKYRLKD